MGKEVGKWSNKEERSPEKGQCIKWTLDLWQIWHCRPWRKDNLFNKHYWGNYISVREKKWDMAPTSYSCTKSIPGWQNSEASRKGIGKLSVKSQIFLCRPHMVSVAYSSSSFFQNLKKKCKNLTLGQYKNRIQGRSASCGLLTPVLDVKIIYLWPAAGKGFLNEAQTINHKKYIDACYVKK